MRKGRAFRVRVVVAAGAAVVSTFGIGLALGGATASGTAAGCCRRPDRQPAGLAGEVVRFLSG